MGTSCDQRTHAEQHFFFSLRAVTRKKKREEKLPAAAVVVSDVAWSGHILVAAAATPVLYRAILMKIGVESSPSSTHGPILDFTLAAHSPDTAVHSLPRAWREYGFFICL